MEHSPHLKEPHATPAPSAEPPVHLSLVIPAYNEESRLEPTLKAAIAFLAPKPYPSEVIVVLDGCTDGTPLLARRYEGSHGACALRVIENAYNEGKGVRVRQGMLAASGDYRFFTDADLSYPLEALDTFLPRLESAGGVVIAKRDTSRVRYQSPLRRLVSWLSCLVMSGLVVPGVSDTQAGFKGFTADVANDLFAHQRLKGFGFDAEILHIAHGRGYPIAPMLTSWVDVPGSKVRFVRDIPRMALELASILINRLLGRYGRKAQ